MKILVSGHVFYHTHNAAKFRLLEVVNVLRSLGHEVTIFDGLSPEPATAYGDGSGVRFVRALPAIGFLQSLMRKTGVGYALLSHPIVRERFDAVYCYGTELSWLLSMWRIARRHRGRMVVDVPELYGFEGMFATMSYFRTRISGWLGIFPAVPLLADTVFVPSRRFVNLFSKLGSDVRLLPPFFADLDPGIRDDQGERTLSLVYAGHPSNKERLSLIFRVLDGIVVDADFRIVFHLVGLNRAEVESMVAECGATRLLSRNNILIDAMGRTDVETARRVVRDADFAIVIRQQSIRVNFGFPSKVAEAFRLGTPIISNIYSDIADYLVDGVNGVMLTDETAGGLDDVLKRCLAMTRTQKTAMRAAAADTGRRIFSDAAASHTLARMCDP